MTRFVVVALTGGRLGNQLFEFASGYGLARRLDAELLFDASRTPPGDLLLPALIGTKFREATRPQLLRVGVDRYSPWPRATQRLVAWSRRARRRGLSKVSVYDFGDPGRYRPWLNDLDPPVWVDGLLQSERYFADVAAEIAEAILFPSDTPRLAASERPTVAVHFRRGDNVPVGWGLPWQYYEDAVAMVAERVSNPQLVLFGDDPVFVELAADRLATFGTVTSTWGMANDPVSHLALMTQCDHAVIANSSFSWWGAWLGDQRTPSDARIVVAPAEYEWGGDLLPKRWCTVTTGLDMSLPLADGSSIPLSGA
jgi:hypothetical protein